MNGSILKPLRARLASWLVLRGFLALAALLAAFALAFLMGDAALNLSDTTRLAAPWILGCAALLFLGLALLPLRHLRDDRMARMLERQQPALGDRLTNAVQLSLATKTEAIAEFLRREAIVLGQRAAGGVRVWPVVRRGVAWAVAGLGIAAVGWVIFIFLAGDVFHAVLPRFLDPRGDHPPFSRLKIDVTPRRGEVLYGGQFEIRASISGRPVDKLWLVAETGASATNLSRSIMFLAPDKTFFQTLANLREPVRYFVTDGQARSRRFPIEIRFTPQITMVEVTTEFPAYTGKPAKTGKLADEPRALPADTRISFRIASNRPLKDGQLTLTPVLGGKPVQTPLKADSQIVTGSFVLAAPTLFTLSVRDVDGLECAEPRRGRFNIAPDERPRIAVLEPGRDAVATPTIKIPVRIQAEDDYGVSRVVWLRGHNRSIERAFNFKLTQRSGPQNVEAAGAFDMTKLGVHPGDVIEYFFEAADNDPKGPNVALTRPYRLEIISEEQYKQVLMRMAAKKALFEPYFKQGNWLRRLAERARETARKAQEAKTGTEREEAQKEAEDLSKEIQEYQEALAKLMKNPAMFEVEQDFRESLATQQNQMNQTAQKAKSAARPLNQKSLADVARELSEMSQQEQAEVSQPAQMLAEVARVLARADEFVRLSSAQASVAKMLRRFAERHDALSRAEQVEMEELKQQQTNLREALRRYIETMPELLAKVPADPEYDPLRTDVQNFLKALADEKIDQDMADAIKNLSERDHGSGYALAQLAADKMDKLVAKCSALPSQGKQCTGKRFQPKLSKRAGNSLEQILAAMGGNPGGQGGEGYGLYGEQTALYGPDMELAGEQSGGRREGSQGSGRGRTVAAVAGDSADPGLSPPGTPGRVRLQPDAKFPLKYRELVGDYFKSIAETATDEGEKK
ncbi:MAG: hypothetical protein QOF48_2160 [Verrucomicrobiota bacterium]|jgi:hypothetical protein